MPLVEAPYTPITACIIGCAFKVHSAIGPGVLEKPYKLALASEMKKAGLSFDAEARLPFRYDGKAMGHAYFMDFVVEDMVVIEVKAVVRFAPVHRAQVLSYLKLANLPAGLLLNFNVLSMRDGIKRVLNDGGKA